jgi:hypothetical protein
MGSRVRQLLATLRVAFSPALFSWDGIDLVDGFCLRTLSYSMLTIIMGPILDTVAISHARVGTSCEELGSRVNMSLLHPFTMPTRARYFASSVVTPRGYKARGCPCTYLRPLA